MTVFSIFTHLVLCLQEKACEAFEVFDEMLECEVVIITPHLKTAVLFCLEVSFVLYLVFFPLFIPSQTKVYRNQTVHPSICPNVFISKTPP